MDNILTDIPWIVTTQGHHTVRDTLLKSHDEGFSVSKNQDGFFYSTQMRILCQVAAVVLRYMDADDALDDGFSEEAIDAAFRDLEPGAHLRSGKYPFMQFPLDTEKPGKGPRTAVSTLLPTTVSVHAKRFWDLSAPAEKLTEAQATLWLAVHGLYSSAGNNKVNGKTRQTGSPGLWSVSIGYPVNEAIYEGETLTDTILNSVSRSHVEGGGLPAWADRTGEKSVTVEKMSPLWRDTVMPNAAVVLWEDDMVTRARCGGVPDEWVPLACGDREFKEFHEVRREHDLFYPSYFQEDEDNQKACLLRLPCDGGEVEMAVAWASDSIKFRGKSTERVGEYTAPGTSLVIVYHAFEGTSTTAVLRHSRVISTHPSLWIVSGNDTRPTTNTLRAASEFVSMVAAHEKRISSHKGFLESAAKDILSLYWTGVEYRFRDMALSIRNDDPFGTEDKKEIARIFLSSFDRVTETYALQNPQEVFGLRKRLNISLSKHAGAWIGSGVSPDDKSRAFVTDVVSLCLGEEGRGNRAKLRRALSQSETARQILQEHGLVLPNEHPNSVRAKMGVATLIANHWDIPRGTVTRNDKETRPQRLGKWVAKATKNTPAIEKSVQNLYRLEMEDLVRQLHRLISQKRRDVPLDWAHVMSTLRMWGDRTNPNVAQLRISIARDYFMTIV